MRVSIRARFESWAWDEVKSMDDGKEVLDALYKLLGETFPTETPPADVPLPEKLHDVAEATGPLEILSGDKWIASDKETWRSWTGLRRAWGIEYHGPVYNYLTPEGSPPYTGKRICRCGKCQESVEPTLRDN